MKKPYLILLAIFAGLSIKTEAQDVYVANPFVQPNDSTLNWYGSGDANGDDTLTWDDVTRMQELIDGTFSDPEDIRLFDRTDVNGDQIVDIQDRGMLEEHLNTEPFFQPRWYWNKLRTRVKREEWFQKMVNAADIEETCLDAPPEEGCDCDMYAYNALLQFNGMDSTILSRLLNGFPHDYNFEDNGRFNLPLLFASIRDYSPPGGHAMNTIIAGDNLLDWDDLCNYEPQLRLINIEPGEAYLIGIDAYFRVDGPPKGFINNILVQYCEFEILNLVPSLIWTGGPVLDGTVLYLRDQIPPDVSTSFEEGATYDLEFNASISISDEYFKRAWYSIDGGQTQTALSSGTNTITLPAEEGDFSMLIYAGDDFYNEVLDTVNFSIQIPEDITPPLIDWDISTSGQYGNVISIDWDIEEPNFVYNETWLYHNEDRENIDQIGTKQYQNLPNGTHLFKISSTDNLGNADSVYQEVQVTGVGFENKLHEDEFIVFPNPTSGIITVQNLPQSTVQIVLCDVTGRTVHTVAIKDGADGIEVDLSRLDSGIYLVVTKDDIGQVTGIERIMKQ